MTPEQARAIEETYKILHIAMYNAVYRARNGIAAGETFDWVEQRMLDKLLELGWKPPYQEPKA